MKIFNLVLMFIGLNIFYELIELIFPISKMKMSVKSFVLIIMLYAVCSFIVKI